MSRLKYGIDLGTTNSAIAFIDKGDSVIIKNESQADTTPSCVGFNKKKGVSVGIRTYNALQSDKTRALKLGKKGSSETFISLSERWVLIRSSIPRSWKLIFHQKICRQKYSRN